MTLDQIASLAGAALVLIAYAALQFRGVSKTSSTYLSLNAVGGMLLLYAAIVTRQAGFILLESCWTAISIKGLIIRLKGASPPKGTRPL